MRRGVALGGSPIRRRSVLITLSMLFALTLPGIGVLTSSQRLAARERGRQVGRVARAPQSQEASKRTETVKDAYARLPARFEANQGQADPDVRFVARGAGYALLLSPSGITLALDGSRTNRADELVQLRPVGANPNPELVATDRLPGASNYMLGDDPNRWQTGVPGYASVRYRHLYPGVDLVFHGGQGQLEYDLVIEPGADPGVVSLAFEGVKGIALAASGDLTLSTGSGDIIQRKPVLYQDVGGRRRTVPGGYVLHAGARVGFSVGPFDRTESLVIDPVLSYSSFLGAGGDERGRAIAVDAGGAAYITGETRSANLRTRGAAQGGFNDGTDVFVTKLSTTASGDASLVYSTYLGGSRDESGMGIAVDGRGRAWVTGETASRAVEGKPATGSDAAVAAERAFPTTAGAYQSTLAGRQATPVKRDAFVTLLDTRVSGLASLVYSTYLGSPGDDAGTAITVDAAGMPWVAGYTNSSDFPTTSGVHKPARQGGDEDAFLARFDPAAPQAASTLVASTYLGGTGNDRASGVAADVAGNGYVTGITRSSDFPKSNPESGFQPSLKGGADAFLAKMDPRAGSILYRTYVGGELNDTAFAVAVTPSGRAFITGQTQSADFPKTDNAYQPTKPPGMNAFVTAVDTDTSGPAGGLVYSTYLGGRSIQASFREPPLSCTLTTDNCRGERGLGIAVTTDGDALVAGETDAPDFPTTAGAFQPTKSGTVNGTDAFVAKIDVDADGAASLVYSTYLGGADEDAPGGIAADPPGNAYVTGDTLSSDLPVIDGAFQEKKSGGTDAFLAKIGTADDITPQVTELSPRGGPTAGGTPVTITGTGFANVNRVSFGDSQVPIVTASNTEVRVMSPSHLDGAVNVTVHVGQARSFVKPSSRFYYGDEGRWQPTGSLGIARHGHTATLLQDGRVLVSAGAGLQPDPQVPQLSGQKPRATERQALNSAELYDPRTGRWSLTGSLPDSPQCAPADPNAPPLPPTSGARSLHSATLLTTGKVLVVGGRRPNGSPLCSAQLYDPSTGTWAQAGLLKDARYGHTATLLSDGRVLVVGGASSGNAAIGSAELYDPLATDSSKAWTRPVPTMTVVRYGHTATLLRDGRVLVAGGSSSSTATSNPADPNNPVLHASAEIFSPADSTWAFTCPTVDPKTRQPVAPCDGPGAHPASPRLFHTAGVLPDGKVLLVGGRFDLAPNGINVSAELYDPAADPTKAWSFVPALKRGRSGQAGVVLPSGRPFVAGGIDPDPLGNGEAFDPSVGVWRGAPAMTSLRGTEIGDFGVIPGPTATLLSADPNIFKLDDPGGTPRCGTNCGKVLVVGGSREATAEGRRVTELYTPAAAILGVAPNRGDPGGNYRVTIKGTGFTNYQVRGVRFGDVPAASFRVIDYFTIEAVAPPAPQNRTADVVVETDGGPATARRGFLFKGPPSGVNDLRATAESRSQVRLSFSAPGSNGDNPPPANRYVVKQTGGPLVSAQDFDTAASLCGTVCTFSPAKVGDGLTLTVTGLSPSTTYRYALRAQDDEGTLGPVSNIIDVTMPAGPPAAGGGASTQARSSSNGRQLLVGQAGTPSPPTTAVPAASESVQLTSRPVTPGPIAAAESDGGGTPRWVVILLVLSVLLNLATLGAFLNRRFRRKRIASPLGASDRG